MFKLGRYLKRYWYYIMMIIGLLYLNAQTELALPDYMSKIISVGIQSGGIEDGVVEAIDGITYEHLKLLIDDNDMAIVEGSYTLASTAHKDYPKVDTLYILNDDLSDEAYEKLNQALTMPLLVNYMMSQAEFLDQMPFEVPEDIDVFQLLALMPKEQLQAMKQEATKQIEAMGDSAIQIAVANAVKDLYTQMGRDTTAIQMNYIFTMGLQMLGIALIGTAAFIAVAFLASKVASTIAKWIRNDVFERVTCFGNAEFNRFSTASLITRTTNDVQQVQMVITMILRIVIYAPIMGVGAVLRVMENDAGMTWIIVLTLGILLAVILTTFSIVLPKFKIVQKTVDKLNLVMRENLSGMMVIRAFGNQKDAANRFDEANTAMTKLNLFVNRVMNSVMPLMMFILNCISLLIIWVGGHQIDYGYTNIGDMMAFMQYSMQIIMSFVMIAMIFVMLPRASVACDRIFEVLETEPLVKEPKQALPLKEEMRGVVSFEDVSFSYPGANEEVLSHISFEASPGKTTAIIGSTGSGKSTIIQLIPRFFDVTSGSIKVDGVDIRDVASDDLRQRIGLVLQKGVLFSGTIASNLRFGDEKASHEKLLEVSRIAQAEDFILEKPKGLEEEIAQGGTNVSGGQKQRLSIARALVKNPEILIFDDSFSALDFKTDAKLRKELNELTRQNKQTVIIVGQRISTIMHADEIIVLDEGKIVGKGKHEELLKECEVYQEIAYSQLSKEELNHE